MPSGSAIQMPCLPPEMDVLRLRGDEGEVARPAARRDVVADQPPAGADALDRLGDRFVDDVAQPLCEVANLRGVAGQEEVRRDRLWRGHEQDRTTQGHRRHVGGPSLAARVIGHFRTRPESIAIVPEAAAEGRPVFELHPQEIP